MGRRLGGMEAPNPKCSHNFIFIRNEETNIGYDRSPQWKIYDVFYCSSCLIYRRIPVRIEEPDRQNLGKRIIIERITPP